MFDTERGDEDVQGFFSFFLKVSSEWAGFNSAGLQVSRIGSRAALCFEDSSDSVVCEPVCSAQPSGRLSCKEADTRGRCFPSCLQTPPFGINPLIGFLEQPVLPAWCSLN